MLPRFALLSSALALVFAAGGSALGQTVLYVSASAGSGGDGLAWGTAYTDLQDALDLARTTPSVKEIWVAAGTYRPDRGTGDRSKSFRLKNSLMVLGGFAGTESSRKDRNWKANPTILSGDLGSARSYHVLVADAVNAAALLDGFAIIAGDATGSGADGEGGGLRAELSDLTVADCLFAGNRASDGGGAFCLLGDPSFVNCVFSANTATDETGGLYCLGDSQTPINPAVVGCCFGGNAAGNRGSGAGLTCVSIGGAMTLRNSAFWGNYFFAYDFYPAQFWGNIDAQYTAASETSGWPYGGAGQIKTDPRFANPGGADGLPGTADDDFRLLAGSPCIDAGDSGAVPPDAFDLDDDANSSEPWPYDADASPRLYDDPYTADTGAGGSPVADAGASEGPALGVRLTAASVEIGEGSSQSVDASLNRDPGTTVVVTVAATGVASITATPATLTFTTSDWSTPQAVTISAGQDVDTLDGEANVALTASGLLAGSIAATSLDDDIPPDVIFVDQHATGTGSGLSWANAFTSLQTALGVAAGSGGSVHQIWVADGNYTPHSSDRNKSFVLLNGVALYGGFAGGETSIGQRDWETNIAVINGDLSGNDGAGFTGRADNSYHVLRAEGTDDTAVVDGFLIRGGNADKSGTDEARGGAVFMNLSGTPAFSHCTFSSHRAVLRGGAVEAGIRPACQPTFTDCVFDGNTAPEGGAVDAGGDATPQFLGCVFTNNTADTHGGVLYASGASAVFEDCLLASNQTTGPHGQGGALYISADNTPITLRRCTVQDNSASSGTSTDCKGGGAFLQGFVTLTIDTCTFHHNTSQTGGGVYLGDRAPTVSITDTSFTSNTATLGEGGGISGTAGGPRGPVTRCTFAANTSGGGAGGASFGGVGLVLTDCLFSGNTSAGNGGGLLAAQMNVLNCVFTGNTSTSGTSGSAHVGGGGAWGPDGTKFIDCSFTENHATGTNAAGGGLGLDSGGDVVRCTFVDNDSAGSGGGLGGTYRAGSTVLLCRFAGNTAAVLGGGFEGATRLAGCSFTGNLAASGGGASVYGDAIEGCSFFGNEADAGGGLYLERYTNVTIANSIFWGNTDSGGTGQGAQIGQDERDVNWTIRYGDVQGWDGSHPGTAVIAADPMFFDAAGPDTVVGTGDDSLALDAGSPCLDAGDNGAVVADQLDLDGDSSTSDPLPFDIDGVERFVDDPDTADTGLGTAPIVDHGAWEFVPQARTVVGCRPDCNGDGKLNINDFICFKGQFDARTAYGDYDGDGKWNIKDFIRYQNEWQTVRAGGGCP